MSALEKKVYAALDYWKEALGLNAWDFEIFFREIDEDAMAEVTPTSMYDHAKIVFNPVQLVNKTDSFIERTVIHELLHLLDRDRGMMFEEIQAHLHPEVYKLYERVIYQQTEAMIDRLATILYQERHKHEYSE